MPVKCLREREERERGEREGREGEREGRERGERERERGEREGRERGEISISLTLSADYLISNWQLYTKNRYFEETGFFISIMMSAPMLLIAFIILV